MSSLADDYCDQLKQQFKIEFAAFPPNQPVVLGDFGTLDDHVFVRLGNVTSVFGVTFTGQEFPNQPANFTFTSESSTDVEIHAKGDATPSGVALKAGVDIGFSSKHSVFFNAAGCIPAQIQDQIKLGNDIMALFKAGKWQKNFVVITNLYKGGSTTAVVSASNNSSISLDAQADVPSIDLSDASLKLTVKHSKALALTVVTEGSLTPLFGLSCIQGVFNPDFGPVSLRSLIGPSSEQPRLEATKDGDFLLFRQLS